MWSLHMFLHVELEEGPAVSVPRPEALPTVGAQQSLVHVFIRTSRKETCLIFILPSECNLCACQLCVLKTQMGPCSCHPLRLEVESGLFSQPGVISSDLGGGSILLFVLQCNSRVPPSPTPAPADLITLSHAVFMT